MIYAPAHNFQARDMIYTHKADPLSCGEGEKAVASEHGSGINLCGQSVCHREKKVMLIRASVSCSILNEAHVPEGLNSDGPQGAYNTLTQAEEHTFACLCAVSVVFREKGNKTWGWGSAIFRPKWKIYNCCGSSA